MSHTHFDSSFLVSCARLSVALSQITSRLWQEVRFLLSSGQTDETVAVGHMPPVSVQSAWRQIPETVLVQIAGSCDEFTV